MTSTPPPGDERAELEAEVVQARQSLGDTVDELSAKLDVKTRAKEKVADRTEAVKLTGRRVAETATSTYEQRPTTVYGVAAALIAATAVVVWLVRRRS